MKNHFRWEKQFFSSIYSIYSDSQIVGKLRDKSFSHTAIGELKGKQYTFKTKGLFSQNTEIIDNKENKVIGKITYSSWMTKATLSIINKSLQWKYDNVWNTRWSLFDKEGLEIKYTGSSTSGRIESNTDDPLLLLCGLFVTNYYWQVSIAVMLLIFIPVYTALLN